MADARDRGKKHVTESLLHNRNSLGVRSHHSKYNSARICHTMVEAASFELTIWLSRVHAGHAGEHILAGDR